ncbi:MAG: LacI family DNA-binding transcriptional regulator, partial [Xanthobacteraceae bacterium]
MITGLRPVAEESRRLVHAAIDELGFKANYMASSLRLGKSRTIGVVVPNLANEFYASLVRHYETEAAQIGYEVLVVASGEDPHTEATRIGSLIARRVDGLLVVPADDDFGSVATFPKNLPPTVLVDRNFGNPRFDAVASDNFSAGKMGCELLLQLGHR